MLSSERIQQIYRQLDNIPTSWNTKRKRGYRRKLNKQLKEYDYASILPPFEPTTYELIYINRTTSIETLAQLNQQINQTKIFTMDTESVTAKFKPNIPTLIQVQMCFETTTMVLIIETHHLPEENQQEFNLIRSLFASLLKRDKQLYIWGDVSELEPFINFGLFNQQQISTSNYRNIQSEFKQYWEQKYPHNPDPNATCECKRCFGIKHDNAIALQDAIAFKLHQHLDKSSSCEAFNIGLDKELNHSKLTREEIEYRERLTTYAANDCDAIYQLILKSNLINDHYGNYDLSIEDIDQIDEMLIDEQTTTEEAQTTSEVRTTMNTRDQEQSTAPDETHSSTARTARWENPLSKEERMKIHNRSRSRHQRIKAYAEEFIIHNIDERFPVRIMKKILKEHEVPITRIHPTESKRTHETILFVGLKKPISKAKYNEVKHLFNREHYRRMSLDKSNNIRNRHQGNTRSMTTANRRPNTHRDDREEYQSR